MRKINKAKIKATLLCAMLAAGSAQAADKELLDILLGNGAITQEQYDYLLSRDSLSAADLAGAPRANEASSSTTPLTPRPIVDILPDKIEALEERVQQQEQEIENLMDRNTGLRVASTWSESFQMRGYLQTRYTQMLDGDKGVNLWSDRSVGDADSLGDSDKNYLIRRARLVFLGDVGDRLSFYIQPDMASSASGTGNIMQMRDAYGDFYLTTDRVHRLRIGQSKVPYGFENLQSSSNRLTLDRNDALNSAVRDERDLGMFYYYTPTDVQEAFNAISSAGLKHSGNYGMFGLGLYNGQGANRGDRNDNQHVVARLTYPWQFGDGQFFEAGVQAYKGQYVPTVSAYRGLDGFTHTPNVAQQFAKGFDDERVGVTAIWYPQPFGVQAEWNWGTTPALDLATNQIKQESLNGGYVQAMFKHDSPDFGTFIPFVRWQYYDGANKAEANAPTNHVNDWELGVEWQVAEEVELAAVWHRMKRNNLVTGNRAGRPDYQLFEADALRLQIQFNY